MDHEDSVWHARIPADIDRPEPVLWNLTARQLLLLTPAALTTWALFCALVCSIQMSSFSSNGGVRPMSDTAASQLASINGQMRKQ